MKRFRLFSILLVAALAACHASTSSTVNAVSSAVSSAVHQAAAVPGRTAMVGTWACNGTLNGRTSIRGYYLTLNADGTGTAQVRTPRGNTPVIPLTHTPWWASSHASMLNWKSPNHWVMTNFPGGHGLTIDCIRA